MARLNDPTRFRLTREPTIKPPAVHKMSYTNINLTGNHGLGELAAKSVTFTHNLWRRPLQQNEQPNFDSTACQESNLNLITHKYEQDRWSSAVSTLCGGVNVLNQEHPTDDLNLCSVSSICQAPLCRQFWKAGNYDDKLTSESTCQNGTSYMRIHPKFLHSNATSHKWAFGAFAELLDNAVDEIKNGATFVIVDKTSNPRDRSPALVIQDDGGGMDAESMRHCLSFGFSDKNSTTAIGRYGNGFKTSSMRLGADAVVLSRCFNDRHLTQSVGLLSYTFLMQTRQDRIVVPMVDYQFDLQTGTWNILYDEIQFKNNLAILLQWSPFTTETELLKHCDDIGGHGTKIMIYNLWHNDEGEMELDFESDLEDICVSGEGKCTAEVGSRMELNKHHLANRLYYSLRAYLSILYLRVPENFYIVLRGRVVEYHNIANDLKFPEFIVYKPQHVEASIITAIGFLKEAPRVNIHGFNVYHKNRLILPFWHVVSYGQSRGRGVVGVLEANFIEPIHNKQDFEKTPDFQKLEDRLKRMTLEYWDYHCGLIGYQQIRKRPRTTRMPRASSDFRPGGIYQPILLGSKPALATVPKLCAAPGTMPHETNTSSNIVAAISGISLQSLYQNSRGLPLKRKLLDQVVDPERVKRTGMIGSSSSYTMIGGDVQVENHNAANLILENIRLLTLCQEYEKTEETLNLKVKWLKMELQAAHHEFARLLFESESSENVYC